MRSFRSQKMEWRWCGLIRNRSRNFDATTIAIEDYVRVESNAGALPAFRSEAAHPWADEWRKLDQSQLVAAANVAPSRPSFAQELQEAVTRGGGFLLQSLTPVIDYADWAVAGASLDGKIKLGGIAQCDTEEHSQQVATILQAVITLSSGLLYEQEQMMLAGLAKLPTDEAAAMRPLGEKALSLVKDFVASARPTPVGSQVELAFESELMELTDTAAAVRFLLPAVRAARAAARRTVSQNNLRILAIAMLNYESANGQFPPPVLYKEGSEHPYSWRVALLPYLEQQALYDRYQFDQPWDSEANKLVSKTVVSVFSVTV